MEKENKCNYCWKCKFFNAYYTKGIKKFDRTELGLCTQKIKIVNKNETCEKYQLKSRLGRSKFLIKHSLNDLLTEISEIRKIIEAEYDEDKKM